MEYFREGSKTVVCHRVGRYTNHAGEKEKRDITSKGDRSGYGRGDSVFRTNSAFTHTTEPKGT